MTSQSSFGGLLEIRRKFAEEQFEFSKHAVDRSILRQIRVQEIREAIIKGQIIEDYPDDQYGPSCLICDVTMTLPKGDRLKMTANWQEPWLKRR